MVFRKGNGFNIYKDYKLLNIILQDEFASLPAVVPKGPIAIFGLVIHPFLVLLGETILLELYSL